MAVGECTGEDADLLRRAMGSKRGGERAESHSLSFALLVYASSWIKLHYPAAFLAGLLRAQPMGFYSPATLVSDARRHGVEVRRPDLHASGVWAGVEPLMPDAASDLARMPTPTGMDACTHRIQPPV